LGDFLDIPVKQYSSGMFMRLAFSIVIHLDANIILLDEVFSVGDVSFREKCNKKILNLKNTGATILFVSHDITSVSQLCSKILLIDDGKVIDINTNETILKKYIEHGFCKKNNATDVSLFKVVKSFEIYTYTYTITEFKSKEIKCPIILKLFNSDLDGNFNCNNEFIIGLEYKKSEDSNYLVPIINLKYYLSSNMDISFNPLIYNESFKVNFISELSINVFCKIPPHFLNSGLFFISIFFIDENSKSVLQFENFATFKISYNKDSLKSIFYDGNFSGAMTPRVEWEFF
jgi:hypothetical protein